MNAGERHAGLFYVIDGFLDILLPLDDSPETRPVHAETPRTPHPNRRPEASKASASAKGKMPSGPHRERSSVQDEKARQHLFTVKPGGIAGYLGTL